MLLGAVFKVTGTQPLTVMPLKGDYSKRDLPRSARYHGVRFRMPSKFPDRHAGTGADRVVAEGDRPRRSAPLVKALYRAYFVEDRDISDPDVAADVAAEAGFNRDGARAAIDDPAIKDPLKRDVEAAIAARRFRFALHLRRRRAVLGHRSFRSDRTLARERAGSDMADYVLHCFAQSGNAYKPALMLELAGADWTPRFVDYFGGETRTPAYRAINVMGEVPVLEHGGQRVSQSGVILDYLAPSRSASSAPRDEDERREVLRWLLFDNHKFTSYTATYRFMRTFAQERRTRRCSRSFASAPRPRGGILIAHLDGRRYVVAERLTIADLSLCGYLFWPRRSGSTGATIRICATGSPALRDEPGWVHPYALMPGHPRAA